MTAVTIWSPGNSRGLSPAVQESLGLVGIDLRVHGEDLGGRRGHGTVDEDGDAGEPAGFHQVVDAGHDFLGSAHGEGRDDDLPAPVQGPLEDSEELFRPVLRFLPLPVSVGGLHDEVVRLLERTPGGRAAGRPPRPGRRRRGFGGRQLDLSQYVQLHDPGSQDMSGQVVGRRPDSLDLELLVEINGLELIQGPEGIVLRVEGRDPGGVFSQLSSAA